MQPKPSNEAKQIDDAHFVRLVFFPVGHGNCTLVGLPALQPSGIRTYGVIDCSDSSAQTDSRLPSHAVVPI
jgi:hypothetical protein